MNENIKILSLGSLGNRLKNLASGMILSDLTGKDLLVYWIVNHYFGCNFEDIFEHPKLNICKEFKGTPKLSIERNKDSELIINEKTITIGNISEDEKNIVSKIFKKFKPIKEVQDIINFYINKFNLENKFTVGIHYRYDDEWIKCRPDISEKIRNGTNFIELFKSKIFNYNQDNTQFFLSCPNSKIASNFFDINNIIFQDKCIEQNLEVKNLNRNKEGIIEAVIDLYLLSMCKEIIVTPASTFSECSWYLGGCSARVFNPISGNYTI